MSEQEFEQMQAALVASMTQDDGEIIVGDDGDDDGDEQINPGMLQQMMGMFGYGAADQEDGGEEEKKDG